MEIGARKRVEHRAELELTLKPLGSQVVPSWSSEAQEGPLNNSTDPEAGLQYPPPCPARQAPGAGLSRLASYGLWPFKQPRRHWSHVKRHLQDTPWEVPRRVPRTSPNKGPLSSCSSDGPCLAAGWAALCPTWERSWEWAMGGGR